MNRDNRNDEAFRTTVPMLSDAHKKFLRKRKIPSKAQEANTFCFPGAPEDTSSNQNSIDIAKQEVPRLGMHPERLSHIQRENIKETGNLVNRSFTSLEWKTANGQHAIVEKAQVKSVLHISSQNSRVSALNGYSEPPMLNVLVGPELQVFRIDWKLACSRSDKLRKRFENLGIHDRSASLEINLQNVNVELFETWNAWAHGNKNLEGHDMKSLYQLYFLAADLRSSELQDLVLDNLKERYHRSDTWPNQDRVLHVYRNTVANSPLRHFMVYCVFFRLMVRREDIHTYFGTIVADCEFVRTYIQLVQDRASEESYKDPRVTNDCIFNGCQIGEGEKCSRSVSEQIESTKGPSELFF